MVCMIRITSINWHINFSTDIVYVHMDLNTRVRTMGQVYGHRSNRVVLS